jgi:ABC-2 type transport system permease protein
MAEETMPVGAIDPHTRLTPREALLQRAATIFGWGAIVNGVLAGLVLLLGIGAALRITPGLFASLHNLLLANLSIPDDIALIAIMLMILANVGGLLLLVIGTLAQELWALVLVWVWSIVNGVALLAFGFTPAVLTLVVTVWAGVLMSRDRYAFRFNPVMLKELRGRMRGMRAFVVITVYLGLMSIVTVLVYLIYTPLNQGRFTSVTGELGRIVFLAVVGIELLLIIFIAPAFTAGAITGERERKTYDLLQTTLLPNSSFITGKLQSALGYILLLLLAAVPLQSIAFLFGGVSELELGVAFVVLSVAAVALGAVGLYFSSTVDRTLTATVRAYTVALIVTFGIPLVMSILLNFYGNALTGVGTGIKNSPVLETILIYIGLILTSLNPITTGLYSQYMLIEYRELGYVVITLNSDGSQIPLISPWISFTIIYLVLSVILILLTVRRMRHIDL